MVPVASRATVPRLPPCRSKRTDAHRKKKKERYCAAAQPPPKRQRIDKPYKTRGPKLNQSVYKFVLGTSPRPHFAKPNDFGHPVKLTCPRAPGLWQAHVCSNRFAETCTCDHDHMNATTVPSASFCANVLNQGIPIVLIRRGNCSHVELFRKTYKDI